MSTRLTRTVLALIALSTVAGCSGQKIQTLKDAVCCDGGYEYRYGDRFAAEKASSDRFAALERERQGLSDELAAARKENEALSAKSRSLEDQLANRDRELTSSRAKTESVQPTSPCRPSWRARAKDSSRSTVARTRSPCA